MDIKDYIHLYLGCEVNITIYDKVHLGILSGLNSDYFFIKVRGDRAETPHRDYSKLKLILRPLSDMTEGDKIEMYDSLFDDQIHYPNMSDAYKSNFVRIKMANFEPVVFVWLLSKHFDLFGLIDAGLAIDKTVKNT